MRTFQLLGQNIAYSLSPAIHAAALAHLGLPHRYIITEATASTLPELIRALRGTTGGANVTVPFKTTAARACDHLTADAAAMGAVNTIVVEGDRLFGHNTDLPAVAAEIDALRPDGAHHAVVLGNGGASLAVQRALASRAERVTVAQRRDGTLPTAHELLATADLLVNATPIGTGSAETPIDPRFLHPGLAVLDLVYRPTPTALARAAAGVGAPAASGGGMLVGQAWRSLALWLRADGVEVTEEIAPIMETALLERLEAEDA